MGMISNKAATIKKAKDIGREMKVEKSPLDNMRDSRKFSSNMGPNTRANTIGAPSYRNFFIKNPDNPEDQHHQHISHIISNTIRSDQTK